MPRKITDDQKEKVKKYLANPEMTFPLISARTGVGVHKIGAINREERIRPVPGDPDFKQRKSWL